MRRNVKLAGLAILMSLLPYGIGLRYPFVFDDHAVIEDNAFLSEPHAWLIALTGRTLWDSRIPDSGRPAAIMSYLTDHILWGKNATGYRITNWAWHSLVVVLVYSLLWRLAGSPFLSFTAALLFGLHPILVETVHSPAFREDLLATAGVIAFVLAAPRIGLALIPLVVALGAKESAVVGVPLLLWFERCFPIHRPASWRHGAIIGGGLLATAMFVAAWALSGTLQALSPDGPPAPLPFPSNIWTAPWLFLRLLRFLLWPQPLRVEHVIDPVASFWDLRFWCGMIVFAGWLTAAWKIRTRRPLVAFGMGWVALSFVPVSNLVPLHNPFAERYAYMACVGFAIILASLLNDIQAPRLRRLAPALLAGLYAWGIAIPLRAWRNDLSLWQRVLAYEPRSARAWTWTGLALKQSGLREEARAHFQRALELNPDESAALVNLGIMLGEEGQLDEAELIFRDAVARRPDKAETWWNLAVCLHKQGRDAEALEAARHALSANPYLPAARALFASSQPGSL